MTAATLSFTSSFFAFSAKVGQSLAPSSTMILIFRPSTPPIALICSMASCSAWMEPVSLMAIVPVAECNWPTVTSVSVTASPVVLTFAVGKLSDATSAILGRPEMSRTTSSEVTRRRVERSVFMIRVQLRFHGRGLVIRFVRSLMVCQRRQTTQQRRYQRGSWRNRSRSDRDVALLRRKQ
jgi:hypothetical protein